MGTSSDASLGSLRIQARQRSDMEGNESISDPEFNQYISQSYKELTDLLVAAYGNEYYMATTYQFNVGNAQLYPLPDGSTNFTNTTGSTAAKFYKLIGVDLQYSASPSGWVTLKRFEMIERNKYAYPNSAINFNGYSNLRYRLSGNNIMFMPIPMAGQLMQLWYIPAPTPLQYLLPCGATLGSQSITLTSTVGLAPGMNVSGDVIVQGTTLSSVGSTSVVLSSAPLATNASAMIYFWNDATLLDGIAGWEEFVVIDAAIKAQIKQENDFSGLGAQKADMVARIQGMAEGRDAGQAQHVSDVLGCNSYGFDGMGDGGWGQGGGY